MNKAKVHLGNSSLRTFVKTERFLRNETVITICSALSLPGYLMFQKNTSELANCHFYARDSLDFYQS